MDRLRPNSANSTPLSPLGFLERAAIVAGDRPSVVYDGKHHTWGETHVRCLRLASALSCHIRIYRGDVVRPWNSCLVLAPNTPAMYEMHFSVPMSGAVLNTINIRLDARTISVLLRHPPPVCCSSTCNTSPLARSALALLSLTTTILFSSQSRMPLPRLMATAALPTKRLSDLATQNSHGYDPTPSGLRWSSTIPRAPPPLEGRRPSTAGFPLRPQLPRGMAAPSIPSTSGPSPCSTPTAGASHGPSPPTSAPMFAPSLTVPPSSQLLLTTASRTSALPPVVLTMLADTPPAARRPLPNPVNILTARSPPPAVVISRVESVGFFVSHGLAAATGGRAGSVESEAGVRTAVMDAADVVDEKTGRRCREMGRRGEVVMRWLSHDGLSRRRGGDGEGRRGGWFYTGDLAVVHPDGENISSVEVETVLYGHPAVAEAAVVANRTTTGETPCAFVVKKEGVGGSPTTEEELISWCREKMPHYMAPKTVVFQPEMPRTSTGKIQKNVLRTMARNLGASAAGQDGRGGVSPF
ncbi:hypothetical protein HPP92_002200 [Vanilla planifolia]|uniref:Uncharacterized protein n=1 Tax=Vanilla planifolia TaxID=51239 RepID=A0A835SE76_VANPL|nr:hypothetical protein HPP92_002200 [Vanilla planifolia]